MSFVSQQQQQQQQQQSSGVICIAGASSSLDAKQLSQQTLDLTFRNASSLKHGFFLKSSAGRSSGLVMERVKMCHHSSSRISLANQRLGQTSTATQPLDPEPYLLKRLSCKAWVCQPPIVCWQVFRLGDGTSQEATTQGAVRDNADAQLATGRDDLTLRVPACDTCYNVRIPSGFKCPKGRSATLPMLKLQHVRMISCSKRACNKWVQNGSRGCMRQCQCPAHDM
jgi:hypothetical protein